MVGGSVFSDRLLPLGSLPCTAICPRASEGVEHAGRVLAQAHLQRQVRVDAVRHPFALTGRADRLAGEPVDHVEGDARLRVGPPGGEVEHAAAADGGELVPVADQRDPRAVSRRRS